MVTGFLGMSLSTCEWLDIATGRSGCLRTWPIDSGSAYEIAFSPDGTKVAASDLNGPLKIYSVLNGNLLYELPDQENDCGESVSFSADGQLLATISHKGEISIRDVATWSLQRSFAGEADSIQFSPDGQLFAASIEDSGIQVWRTSDWQVQWVIPIGRRMRFTADGRMLAAYSANGTIGVWSMKNGEVQHTIHTDAYRFALAPDGTQVATTSFGEAIKIWDVSNNRLLRTIPVQSRGEAVYSPDSQYLLVDEHYNRFLAYIYQFSVWRVADGQQAAVLPAYISTECAAFASRSNVFGYGSWNSLKVFRLRPD